LWKVNPSNVVALSSVDYGPMGWPREQVLNVLITCWSYGPSKPM
jgi:hypothetical protein